MANATEFNRSYEYQAPAHEDAPLIVRLAAYVVGGVTGVVGILSLVQFVLA